MEKETTKNNKRVVVTGLGILSPIGIGIDNFWNANLKGESGVSKIDIFDVSSLDSKIGGQIRDFDPLKYIPEQVMKRSDRFVHLGLAAAKMALNDSSLDLEKIDKEKMSIIVGSGLGGVIFHEEQILRGFEKGFNRLNPWGVPKTTPNSLSGNIAVHFGIKGQNMVISAACASGACAIGEAYLKIKNGYYDISISGGAEAPLTQITFSSYCALNVLSKRNDAPEKASRPFDKNRDGFVLSEGACILILEELNHALKRKAKIYAEVIGYAANSGTHHMVIPQPDGLDLISVMRKAIKSADISVDKIDYINAHGTSTFQNDKVETEAIKQVFGTKAYDIPISSTKSMLGHSIGASGAIEALVCVMAVNENIIPPTINYETKDNDCDLDYVANISRKANINIAMSNSFGFGGCNGCIVFKKFGDQT